MQKSRVRLLRLLRKLSNVTAMLKEIAPRLWASAHETIEAVLEHDCRLHMPLRVPRRETRQPTAFAEVTYEFSVPDSIPRRLARRRPAGWDVVTSLGHYNSTEGELILWEDHTIVRFPPGSTILIPSGIVSYSFAGVSEFFSKRMLIAQLLNGNLYDYVANGFYPEPLRKPQFPTEEARQEARRELAEDLIGMYPTVPEIDGDKYYNH
ncbi:hypothetical protein FB451DRAFT_1047714 [Mycena latifolia]|nr:hypothetical protein FB451DRAFT_1047714 [Mycena latifolia]